MLKNIHYRYIVGSFIVFVALFSATGCSTINLVKEQSDIAIERVDSKSASISHAYLTRTDDQILLKGEIKRRLIGRGSLPGYLHVTLIDPQGQVIMEADIDYMRRNVKSSIATFRALLPVDLAPGSTVQLTHFTTETK